MRAIPSRRSRTRNSPGPSRISGRSSRSTRKSKNVKKVTLDNLYSTIKAGDVQELKVVIKSDVQGSAEALRGLLEKLSTNEVRLNVLRAAAGAITEDDVMLASTSDAIIIAFNVRPSPAAKLLADREKVDIRKYNIIYRAEEEIRKAMEGMLAPDLKEQEIGKVEVREIFKVPKIGIVAGSFVLEGAVRRNCQVRVIRDSVEVFHGKIELAQAFQGRCEGSARRIRVRNRHRGLRRPESRRCHGGLRDRGDAAPHPELAWERKWTR